jgi:ATP-dependent Lon protease
VIVPAKNRKDLEEIPPYIRRKLRYVFVDTMDEILEIALVKTKKINLQKKIIQKRA